jgi:hypothetical protein
MPPPVGKTARPLDRSLLRSNSKGRLSTRGIFPAGSKFVTAALVLLLGSYLGWTAYRTGSTRTSILSHQVNNATALLLGAVASKSSEATSASPTSTQLLITLSAASAICVVFTWAANRMSPAKGERAISVVPA